MYDLKPLSRTAVNAALIKAERYRLLNEPGEAESICLDVLAADPDNQQARITLVLALSEQCLEQPSAGRRAEEIASRLEGEYERNYYSGLVAERRAKAHLRRGGTAMQGVYEWLTDALECFARAEALRPAGNDDAILRWNACVRVLRQHPNLQPTVGSEREVPQFLE
jgi:hypothetical protein